MHIKSCKLQIVNPETDFANPENPEILKEWHPWLMFNMSELIFNICLSINCNAWFGLPFKLRIYNLILIYQFALWMILDSSHNMDIIF